MSEPFYQTPTRSSSRGDTGQRTLLHALLGWHERTVKEGDGPTMLAMLVKHCQGGTPDVLPHALLTPKFETPPHRRGCAIVAREILPAFLRPLIAMVSAGR